MNKSLVTITVALSVVSFGSLISDRAQASSATSAPSKYNGSIIAAQTTSQHPAQVQHTSRTTRDEITSFSSSSYGAAPAKRSVPRR